MQENNDLTWFRVIRPTLAAMTHALKDKKLSPTDIFIYLLVKSSAHHKTGEAELSLPNLSKLTGMSRSTIKRSIANLIGNGYVINKSSAGKVSRYQLYERAPIRVGDEQQLAQWEYIPSRETQVRDELKKYIAGGESPNNVRIENLTVVNVNINVNNNNGSSSVTDDQLDNMLAVIRNPATPKNVRKKIAEVYTQLTGDPGHI